MCAAVVGAARDLASEKPVSLGLYHGPVDPDLSGHDVRRLDPDGLLAVTAELSVVGVGLSAHMVDQPVLIRMDDVLLLGNPFEVVERAVQLVAVLVVDLREIVRVRDEQLGQETMEVPLYPALSVGERNSVIPVRRYVGIQLPALPRPRATERVDARPILAPDDSTIRNLV